MDDQSSARITGATKGYSTGRAQAEAYGGVGNEMADIVIGVMPEQVFILIGKVE